MIFVGFDALDYAVKSIESRFEQTDWIVFRNIQELFLQSLQGKPYKEELDAVMAVYGDDFNKDLLVAQLEELKLYPENSIDNAHELVKFLQQLTTTQKLFMSQVVVLAKLLLVMPATNAVSERSFSALKRVKTYLRGLMKDKRLNNLMILHIHKEKTDAMDLVEVANKFVEWKDKRNQLTQWT